MDIDEITISAPIFLSEEAIWGEEIISFGELKFVAVKHKCAPFPITHYETRIDNLRFTITNRKTGYWLKIQNSAHKFWKGNNYGVFYYSELCAFVSCVEEMTGIKAELFVFSELAVGVNIQPKQNVEDIIEGVKMYKTKKKPFKEMLNDAQYAYGKTCSINEYRIKIYNKTFEARREQKSVVPKNILRIEVVFEKGRMIPFVRTLADLINPDILLQLVAKFKEYIENVIMVGTVDLSNVTEWERDFYFAGLDTKFWTSEKKFFADKGRSKKDRHQALCKRVTKKNPKDEIMRAIDEQIIDLLGS